MILELSGYADLTSWLYDSIIVKVFGCFVYAQVVRGHLNKLEDLLETNDLIGCYIKVERQHLR